MRVASRLIAVSLLSLLLVVAAVPALAVDEPETTTTESTTETTVAEEETTEDVAPPAVTSPPPSTDEPKPDWTYRYLIPTLLALAALVVIATTIQYFLQVVRKRYKVVE